MTYTRRSSDQRCEEICAYITEYVAQNGHSPTFREVGEAVGLHSPATVSRYIHRLIDEGRITIDESKPRTLTAAASSDALEIVRQRICLEMSDGGKIQAEIRARARVLCWRTGRKEHEKSRGTHCSLPDQRRMKEVRHQ